MYPILQENWGLHILGVLLGKHQVLKLENIVATECRY